MSVIRSTAVVHEKRGLSEFGEGRVKSGDHATLCGASRFALNSLQGRGGRPGKASQESSALRNVPAYSRGSLFSTAKTVRQYLGR
jgi:hypothetical protein